MSTERPETPKLQAMLRRKNEKPQSGHPMSWREPEELKEFNKLMNYISELESRLYRVKKAVEKA
jgi:hypothetical protein